jgi:hypothetical protein
MPPAQVVVSVASVPLRKQPQAAFTRAKNPKIAYRTMNAHLRPRDALERKLHKLVCPGNLDLNGAKRDSVKLD